MVLDRYTKILLTVIAISLLLIAINPWIKPIIAEASYHDGTRVIESVLREIARAISSISC